MKKIILKKQEINIIDGEKVFIIEIDRIHNYSYLESSYIYYSIKNEKLILEIKNDIETIQYQIEINNIYLENLLSLKAIIIIESSDKFNDINYMAENSMLN